ncbi:hypothetical protein M433DRAFT_64399 [Acidomyces richmondensis BFW]|nr:MAG: hypothetical protein FE78DRAFT_144487 [Acidomyces sp. 'richmondensis']KYG46798.1 hypothetical protein M433DRAFT_64399 [Acidomyces richmondensis BFW]
MNAFSVLGKRKALAPISNDTRPSNKHGRLSSKREATSLTQMQISLGQEVQKKCKTCGMEYVLSSVEDRRLHDKYHKQNTEGCEVGKDFVQKSRAHTAFEGARSGDRICVVDNSDTYARRKKALAALEIVQREMGAVPISEKQIWGVKGAGVPTDDTEPRCAAYMYIRNNKCIGFLLVERIMEAQRVVAPPTSRAEEGMLARAESCPIQLSAMKYPALIGVSRIWTSPSHRHQNIATTLAVQVGHLQSLGNDLGKEDLAFSQPTEAGARLARKWFGKPYGWMVYVD